MEFWERPCKLRQNVVLITLYLKRNYTCLLYIKCCLHQGISEQQPHSLNNKTNPASCMYYATFRFFCNMPHTVCTVINNWHPETLLHNRPSQSSHFAFVIHGNQSEAHVQNRLVPTWQSRSQISTNDVFWMRILTQLIPELSMFICHRSSLLFPKL